MSEKRVRNVLNNKTLGELKIISGVGGNITCARWNCKLMSFVRSSEKCVRVNTEYIC